MLSIALARATLLPGLINRFGLPPMESQLWVRTVRKNMGAQALSPGKEIHFYFSRGLGKTAMSQLKALEVDYSDTWTLTWEKESEGYPFPKARETLGC